MAERREIHLLLKIMIAKEPEEDVWAREERGDAILAEKRDPLRVDGGCGDD